MDDHEILQFASKTPIHPQAIALPASVDSVVANDLINGRFRPLYYPIRMGLVAAFGTNPFLWHLLVFLAGALTTSLLFGAFRSLGFSVIPSFAFAALTIFSPNANYAWIMLGTQEGLGTLFLAATLFALSQATTRDQSILWNTLFVILALTTGLMKESYVFVIPALMYMRILFAAQHRNESVWKAIRRDQISLVLVTIGFVTEAAFVAIAAKIGGLQSYGGRSLNFGTEDIISLATTLGGAIVEGGFFVPVVLFLVSCWQLKLRLANSWKTIALIGLWVIPQFLLYATRGGIVGFYWLPATIGFALANSLGLAKLMVHNKMIATIATGWLIAWLLVSGGEVFAHAERFRADSTALNHMLDYVADHVARNQAIAIAADPIQDFEQTTSVIYHIGRRGRSDIRILYLPVENPTTSSGSKSYLASSLEKYFEGNNALADLKPEQLDAVLLFVNQNELPKDWYTEYANNAKLINFTEAFFAPLINRNGISLANNADYQILWVRP